MNFVSFIIPVLNRADVIEECLKSIQNINYPKDSFEIIIMDNGSKDATLEIAKKFTDKIYIDTTATIAGLRNLGAKKAKGDFFAFIDSDCIISNNWLNIALDYLKDRNIGLVGSKTYLLPNNTTWVRKVWKLHLDREIGVKEVLWLPSEAILIKRDIFLDIGGFNESLETCEDVDFGYRIHKQYKIISDERLAPIHMDKTKTLLDFFKKEIWRGKNGLQVSLKHLGEWKEVRSLIVTFYYLTFFILLVPAIVLALFMKNAIYLAIDLICIILPLALVSFDTCRKVKKFSSFGKLFIIYGCYILARIIAIFRFRWKK